MSTRSTQSNNRQEGNKGFNKTQKKFVPKTYNSSRREYVTNPPLTTSLRSPDVSIVSSSSSASSVRTRGNGNWVSGGKQGNFVNYLPQDEAVAAGLGVENGALDPVESQRVVDLLNRELSRLLKLNSRDFWKEVARDTSLHDFLDSFLQFRNRWYDFPHHGAKETVAGVIVGEFELSRRVFMIFYRISSNKDPGAHARDSLSMKEHEALLHEKKLLDLPKLLDLCAIYGHENEELINLLVMNAMKAQPMLHENLLAVASRFVSIVHTMHQRCDSSLEALFSSGGPQDHGDSRLCADFLEVMDFVNDAITSMDAFVKAYKVAALYFSCHVEMSYGNGDLLGTLATLHDSLLPSLQRGFGHIFTGRVDGVQNSFGCSFSNISISFRMLFMRIINFSWKLLDLCYLSNEVFDGSLPLPTATKMFPANVEDPVIRGDILVQFFRKINDEVSHNFMENKSSGTFLQNVEKNYKILARLDELRGNGWIFMDDEQYQYLSRIIMPPAEVMNKDINLPISLINNNVLVDEDIAITESKISQIKDLFPDFGKGFLAACLEVYNQNPEEVIQRILEGTLHEDLQSLDISLDKIPPPKSAPPRNDKGKKVLVEPIAPPSTKVFATVEERQNEGPSFSSSSSIGRYTRKSKVDLLTPTTLDSSVDKYSAKTAILASQYEYEDEYDDSFDDLGLSLVESGFEETEILGDRISSNPGKSWGEETENPAQNNSGSRWNSRKKPQFYVKDGKNYSYKVSGSVAVANSREAALVNQAQKEQIHGLGRGGNLPLGAVKALEEANEQQEQQDFNASEMGGRGNPANSRGGRGRRGGGGNNYRKDRAMKKHFAGLGGGY